MQTIYMDHAATTPIAPEVFEAMKPFLTTCFANAASTHHLGAAVNRQVVFAREKLARLMNCRPGNITFTSGATEANNQAISTAARIARENGRMRIVTTAIEHESVLEPMRRLAAQGFDVAYVRPDRFGNVTAQQILDEADDRTGLISMMLVNNEIGTILPVAEVAHAIAKRPILLHVDAVAAMGHQQVDFSALGGHFMSFSGHKFNGPKGIGALVSAPGVMPDPLILGGHQERGRRAGTTDAAGIVGMAEALGLSIAGMAEGNARVAVLSARLLSGLMAMPGAHLIGAARLRSPRIINIAFEGVDRESLLFELDHRGICLSGQSACAAGAGTHSHVLASMGISEALLDGAVRFSLSPGNTEGEVERVIEAVAESVALIRKRRDR